MQQPSSCRMEPGSNNLHRSSMLSPQNIGSFPQQEITRVQDILSSAAASNAIGRLPPELQDAVRGQLWLVWCGWLDWLVG